MRNTEASPSSIPENEAGITAPKLLILADDLTGACDSGVAFAQRGIRTQVVLDEGSGLTSDAEVLVRSTDSRNVDSGEALRRLIAASGEARNGTLLFKKVDSVFRGNTFMEVLSTVELMPHEVAIIAPAYPDLHRKSVDGVVVRTDLTGEHRIPVLQKLRSRGLHVGHVAATQDSRVLLSDLSQSLREGEHVMYCDAGSHGDLVALVEATMQLQRRVLWIGSGGLAHALAGHMQQKRSAPPWPARRGTVVIFAGSDHPVTQEQLDHLGGTGQVLKHSVCDLDIPAAERGPVIVLRVPHGKATKEDIQRAMRSLPAESIGCLFMTGGDTAALVCRSLEIHALSLISEFESGLPIARAIGGLYENVIVILKSGGFGEHDSLSRISGHFSS